MVDERLMTNDRFVMCMNCIHAVWPQHELGYCAHPDVADALTTEARNTDGVCGPIGKLYEEKNERFES